MIGMKQLLTVYRFAVLGALGGLIGSILHQQLLLNALSQSMMPSRRMAYLSLLGAMVGASIGFFPSLTEGLRHYSLRVALHVGLIGAGLGAFGGFLALPAAEILHGMIGGGTQGRITALALMGLTIGISEGINGGARWWRGVVGGGLGGAAAGGLLEILLNRQTTYSDSAILALMLIGTSISLFVSLFVNVLSEAWLESLPGSKASGQIYHLGKFRHPREAIIGSDKKGVVFVWVPDSHPRHASLTLTDSGTLLRHIAKGGETRVDGTPVVERLLRAGEIIQIGSARLRYHEKRKPTRFVNATV